MEALSVQSSRGATCKVALSPPPAQCPVDRHAGEGDRSRVAGAAQPLECGAAGIREAEHACALVERLARGVVERTPEDLIAVAGGDERQKRVPPACDQTH